MAAALRDGRRQSHVTHSHEELLAERIALICHGYEDANDCDRLRDDAAFRAAAECVPGSPALASQPTMTRFENNVGRRELLKRIVRRIRARFVVTDLEGVGAKVIYETLYCDRGNAELMIKEHKCFLKSSRTRCTTAEANPFRLFLHSAAYVIMHGLRETVLKGTGMATATFDTIRLRLLKVAARVQTGRTFVRFHLPVACPAAAAFGRTAALASAGRVT